VIQVNTLLTANGSSDITALPPASTKLESAKPTGKSAKR
jgi:outer membrane protein